MSINKKSLGLIAFFIIQIILLIALNRFFVNDMREDVTMMRQELIEKGMPNEQASEIGSALRSIITGISGYVLQTAMFLVIINSLLVMQIAKKQDQEKENTDE